MTAPFEKIYDAFIFNGELEMLDARCAYYGEQVDYFEVFESPQTISGVPKNAPLLSDLKSGGYDFSKDYPSLALYLDKVWVHRIIIPSSTGDSWAREHFMRMFAYNHLQYAVRTNAGSSLVFFGDVDEFPEQRFYTRDRTNNWYTQPGFCYSVPMLMSYWNAHNLKNNNWYGTRIADNMHPIFNMRKIDNPIERIEYCGWHFSYAGGSERVWQKLKSFPHTELSADETIERAIERMKRGEDPFGRTDHTWTYAEEFVTNSNGERFPIVPEVLREKAPFLLTTLHKDSL